MADTSDQVVSAPPGDPTENARAAVAAFNATNAANAVKKTAAPTRGPQGRGPQPVASPQPAAQPAGPTYTDAQGRVLPLTDAMKDVLRMKENDPQFAGWTPEEIAHWKAFQAKRLGLAPPQPSEPNAAPAAADADADIAPEDYHLEFPAMPDDQVRDEDVATAASFEDAAYNSGLSREVAQDGLNAVFDAASALGNFHEGTSENSDDCERVIRSACGSRADDIIKLAQHNARELGLSEWLDSEGPDGRQPGNNPAVLLVLANAGLYRLSKAESTKELSKWMKSKEYMAGDRNALVAVRMLSQVAHREAAPKADTTLGAVESAKQEIASAQKRAGANETAKKLLEEMRLGGPAAAAAEKKWLTLVAKL